MQRVLNGSPGSASAARACRLNADFFQIPRRQVLPASAARGFSLAHQSVVLRNKRYFSSGDVGASVEAMTEGPSRSAVSATRHFRIRASSFLRSGNLVARLNALPHVSWRSLLRVLNLVLSQPEAIRVNDLVSLPALCGRLSVGSIQVVDRVVCAGALSPSLFFASLAEQQQRRLALEGTAFVESKDGVDNALPFLSDFLERLSDWRIDNHGWHRLALQRFFLAAALASGDSAESDLLLILDSLASLSIRRGGVPVDSMEEFALCVELLLRRVLSRRQGQDALFADLEEAVQAFLSVAWLPVAPLEPPMELANFRHEDQLRPLADLVTKARLQEAEPEKSCPLSKLQTALARRLAQDASQLAEDSRKTAAVLCAASAILVARSSVEASEASEASWALLTAIEESLLERGQTNWKEQDAALLWRVALRLPQRQLPKFASVLYHLDEKAGLCSISFVEAKMRVAAQSAACWSLKDLRGTRLWTRRALNCAEVVLQKKDAPSLPSAAQAFSALATMDAALKVARKSHGKLRGPASTSPLLRLYRQLQRSSGPSERRRLIGLQRLSKSFIQRAVSTRTQNTASTDEALTSLVRAALLSSSPKASSLGVWLAEALSQGGRLRQVALALRLCATDTAAKLAHAASRARPAYRKSPVRPWRAGETSNSPTLPAALEYLFNSVQTRVQGVRCWMEDACGPSAPSAVENLTSMQRFNRNRQEFILREATLAPKAASLWPLLGVSPSEAFEARPGRTARQEAAAVSIQVGKAEAETAEVETRLLIKSKSCASFSSECLRPLARYKERAADNRRRRALELLRALRQTLLELAKESRRCLYTAVVQQPLQRKQRVAPCAGEVSWIQSEALRLQVLAAETFEAQGLGASLEGRPTEGDRARRDALRNLIIKMEEGHAAKAVCWGEAYKAPRRSYLKI